MRKILLLTAAGLVAGGMMAQNYTIKDFYTMGISQNGEYIVSQDFDGISTWNVKENKLVVKVGMNEYTDPGIQNFSIGNGNLINDKGWFVGSNSYGSEDEACLWNGVAWMKLCDRGVEKTSNANGITSDGSRICGYATGLTGLISSVRPVYWDVVGGVWTIFDLPFPNTDFSGQPIQGCQALRISDDGKTIVGQVVDQSGMRVLPIVWSQADDQTWSYKMYGEDVVNPEGIKLPEFPEEPNATAYMTSEKKAEYEAAMAEWRKNPLGSDRPDPEAYMEADKLAEYQTVYKEYQEKLEAYQEVYNQIFEKGAGFMMTSIYLSADGKKLAGTVVEESFDENTFSYDVMDWGYIYNLEDGSLKKYKLDEQMITCILNDGTALAGKAPDPMEGSPMIGSILVVGTDEFVPLQDYLKAQDEDAYKFAEENLTHEYQIITWNEDGTYDSSIEKVLAMGLPMMTEDKKTIVGTNYNTWVDGQEIEGYEETEGEEEEIAWCVGYVINIKSKTEGVAGIVDDSAKAPVEYYTADGLRVDNPAAGQLVIRRQGGKASVVVIK